MVKVSMQENFKDVNISTDKYFGDKLSIGNRSWISKALLYITGHTPEEHRTKIAKTFFSDFQERSLNESALEIHYVIADLKRVKNLIKKQKSILVGRKKVIEIQAELINNQDLTQELKDARIKELDQKKKSLSFQEKKLNEYITQFDKLIKQIADYPQNNVHTQSNDRKAPEVTTPSYINFKVLQEMGLWSFYDKVAQEFSLHSKTEYLQSIEYIFKKDELLGARYIEIKKRIEGKISQEKFTFDALSEKSFFKDTIFFKKSALELLIEAQAKLRDELSNKNAVIYVELEKLANKARDQWEEYNESQNENILENTTNPKDFVHQSKENDNYQEKDKWLEEKIKELYQIEYNNNDSVIRKNLDRCEVIAKKLNKVKDLIQPYKKLEKNSPLQYMHEALIQMHKLKRAFYRIAEHYLIRTHDSFINIDNTIRQLSRSQSNTIDDNLTRTFPTYAIAPLIFGFVLSVLTLNTLGLSTAAIFTYSTLFGILSTALTCVINTFNGQNYYLLRGMEGSNSDFIHLANKLFHVNLKAFVVEEILSRNAKAGNNKVLDIYNYDLYVRLKEEQELNPSAFNGIKQVDAFLSLAEIYFGKYTKSAARTAQFRNSQDQDIEQELREYQNQKLTNVDATSIYGLATAPKKLFKKIEKLFKSAAESIDTERGAYFHKKINKDKTRKTLTELRTQIQSQFNKEKDEVGPSRDLSNNLYAQHECFVERFKPQAERALSFKLNIAAQQGQGASV